MGVLMCSIVGIGFQQNHIVFNKSTVYKLITQLLMNGMSRGTTATGLCFTSNKKITIAKNKIKATDFTETKFYKEALDKYACFEGPPDTYLLSTIGHCRQKTKGTELNNGNNHPINYGDVVGVHNGIITNDDAQFNKYKSILSRKAQVDSEIIFALIDYFARSFSSIPKGIQKACEDLTGGYACAMVHRSQPHILWLFRNTVPCSIYHFKEKGIIIFASLPAFIINLISEHTLGAYDEIPFVSHEGIGINLYAHTYQKFDLKVPNSGGYS